MTDVKTSCGCGRTHIKLDVAPRVRFRCHCRKCQAVYGLPYADALMFRRGQVRPEDPDTLKWIRTIKRSPLVRGLCRHCDQPVLGLLFGTLNIVPAGTVTDQDYALPAPVCDIYYDTRVRDLSDNIPKHVTALSSYIGLTMPVTQVLTLPGKRLAAAGGRQRSL
jgi:hypothetical protein